MTRTRCALTAVLLTLAAASLVAACGDDEEEPTESAAPATSAAASSEAAPEPATSEAASEPASSEAAPTEETSATEETAAGDSSAAAPSGEPVVIGFAGSKTGFVSFYDLPVLAGAKLAIEEINAAGGAGGRPLELIETDNKSDPTQIGPAALTVLDQGADILIPSCDYDFGGPGAREATKAGKLTVGCAGGPLYGKTGLGDLVFNTIGGTPDEGRVIAQFAQEQGWTKPYLLQDTSVEYSKTVCEFFEAAWTDAGGELAGKDTFKNDDASVGSQVTRLKGADADSVIICSYPPGGAAAVKQIRDGGIDLPIVGAGAFDGTYWLEGIESLSDFYHPSHGSIVGDDPSADRNALFAALTAAGEPPASATYPLSGYQSIQIVAKALELTGGDADGQALSDAIETFADQDTILGPTTYTDKCHLPFGRPQLMIQIQDGVASLKGEVAPTLPLPPNPESEDGTC